MKKAAIGVIALIAMLAISACQMQSKQDIEVSEVGTIEFYSEEEFIGAVKEAKENPSKKDIADLAGVEFYCKPNKLPPDYVLYLINVGKHDIGIVYILEQDAVSEESAMEAMGRLDYYMLITYRDTPFSVLKQGLGLDEHDKVATTDSARDEFPDKYRYQYGNPDLIFWGNEKVSMMLQYPQNAAETKSEETLYVEAGAEYIELP